MARSSAPPKWVYEELVACLDGPLINQWFTAKDWAERVEAARYMHEERGQRRQACLDYELTARRVQHPKQDGASARVIAHVSRVARKAGRAA